MAAGLLTPQQFAGQARQQAAGLRDMRPLLRLARDEIVHDWQQGLARGVDIHGKPHKALLMRPGGHPLVDTGLLARSLAGGPHHVETITADAVTVGTTRPGAALLNTGGVVTPKRAKWLAIPKTAAARAAGSPRNMGGLFAVFGKKGGVLLDRGGVAHFALVRRAVIPARTFMGFGLRLIGKLKDLAADYWAKHVVPGGRP